MKVKIVSRFLHRAPIDVVWYFKNMAAYWLVPLHYEVRSMPPPPWIRGAHEYFSLEPTWQPRLCHKRLYIFLLIQWGINSQSSETSQKSNCTEAAMLRWSPCDMERPGKRYSNQQCQLSSAFKSSRAKDQACEWRVPDNFSPQSFESSLWSPKCCKNKDKPSHLCFSQILVP